MRASASDSLDEHRAAQAAADADRGHAAPPAGALQHVQHVQDDPRARRADRMAERDGAAVDVELRLRRARPAPPGGRAPACSSRRSATRARSAITCAANASLISHASRSLRPRPWRFRIGVAACTGPSPICAGSSPAHSESTMRPSGVELVLRRPRARTRARATRAPSVICELLPAVTLPYLRSKNGFSFARFSTRRILAHAVVLRVELALRVVQRHDLAVEVPGLLRREHARVARAPRIRPSRAA